MAIEVVNTPAPQTPREGYFSAISEFVPSSFMTQAADVVAAHRPITSEAQSVEAMARVLAVDPKEVWREIYKEMGEQAGHEVVGVTSAIDALKALQKERFDLVITAKLDGDWISVHRAAEKQGAQTVVASGEVSPTIRGGYVKEGSKARDIPFLDKGGGIKEGLMKIFYNLNQESTLIETGAFPSEEAERKIDYSSPFRIRVTRDTRDPEEYGPAGNLTGKFGICLGQFNQETREPDDEDGMPLLQTDSGDTIWGDQSFWDPNPDAHADIPFDVQEAALDLHIAALRVGMGIDSPPQVSEE